jgi:hypothetical protein
MKVSKSCVRGWTAKHIYVIFDYTKTKCVRCWTAWAAQRGSPSPLGALPATGERGAHRNNPFPSACPAKSAAFSDAPANVRGENATITALTAAP